MRIGLGAGISSRTSGYSPNRLFASGEAGDWFDPSDLSRMWQDTAGTVPITADGQAIARWDSKLGRVSLRQATGAKQPLYKTSGGLHWVLFDGTDDSMLSNASLDLTGTDASTVCAAVLKSSDAAIGVITCTAAASPNGFSLNAPAGAASASYLYSHAGTVNAQAQYTNAAVAAPNTSVVTGLGRISNDTTALRVNAVQVATSATDQGTGNLQNGAINVGARLGGASLFFNGRLYFLAIRGALTSGTDLSSLETFAGRKAGLTI